MAGPGSRGGHRSKETRKKTMEKGKNDDTLDKIEIRDELSYTCGTCEVGIQDDYDISIQCDGPCEKWHHIECEKITEEKLGVLAGGKRNVKWFCNVCIGTVSEFIIEERETDYVEMRKKQKENAQKIKNIEEQLKELSTTLEKDLKDRIKALEREPTPEELGIGDIKNRIENLEKSDREKCNSKDVKGIVDYEIGKVQSNSRNTIRNDNRSENRSRENNILIHRAAEDDSDGQSERDKELVMKLFNTCNAGLEEDKIKKIIRLGRKSEDKTRPILVELERSEDKGNLFKGISELKSGPEELRTLSIGNDLSPEQRKELKALIEEAKQKEQQDPDNKYRVRGPPWNMEIRKIRK
jgi:hypothetical protein